MSNTFLYYIVLMFLFGICAVVPLRPSLYVILFSWQLAFADLDQQQSDSCPHQFAYAHDQCDEDACVGSHSERGHRHEEAALASAQLQGHEEEQVGETAQH